MRNRYVRSTLLSVALLFGVALTLSAQQRWGDAIDPKAPKVTLAEIVAKPAVYDGKMVVVDGTHGGACADGADFYFKDKFEIIEAAPPSPKVMQLKKGTRVRLYGVVKVRHKASEKTEKGGREAGEAEVRIDAKAVEVLK